MLDLYARVHLNEDVVAAIVHEELHGARAGVVDVLAELHRIGADAIAQLWIEEGRRGDFHDLLVAALHGAVALEEVDDVTGRIGEDLHLNVLRVENGGFEVDVAIAKRGGRLAGCLCRLRLQLVRGFHETHAAATAAGDGLDEDREGEVLGILRQLVHVRGRLRVLQSGQARCLRGGDRGRLVAGQLQRFRGRADKRDAVVPARAR